jgi:hypothetical protein
MKWSLNGIPQKISRIQMATWNDLPMELRRRIKGGYSRLKAVSTKEMQVFV